LLWSKLTKVANGPNGKATIQSGLIIGDVQWVTFNL
jgi:hypothetical protein